MVDVSKRTPEVERLFKALHDADCRRCVHGILLEPCTCGWVEAQLRAAVISGTEP